MNKTELKEGNFIENLSDPSQQSYALSHKKFKALWSTQANCAFMDVDYKSPNPEQKMSLNRRSKEVLVWLGLHLALLILSYLFCYIKSY